LIAEEEAKKKKEVWKKKRKISGMLTRGAVPLQSRTIDKTRLFSVISGDGEGSLSSTKDNLNLEG